MGLDCYSKQFLKYTAGIRKYDHYNSGSHHDSGSLSLLPVSEAMMQAGSSASPHTTADQALGVSLEHCPWNHGLKNLCLASMPDLGNFYY